jgi:hypothetical protein
MEMLDDIGISCMLIHLFEINPSILLSQYIFLVTVANCSESSEWFTTMAPVSMRSRCLPNSAKLPATLIFYALDMAVSQAP